MNSGKEERINKIKHHSKPDIYFRFEFQKSAFRLVVRCIGYCRLFVDIVPADGTFIVFSLNCLTHTYTQYARAHTHQSTSMQQVLGCGMRSAYTVHPNLFIFSPIFFGKFFCFTFFDISFVIFLSFDVIFVWRKKCVRLHI